MKSGKKELSIPLLRMFWQRAVFYFVVSFFLSFFLAWILNQFDLQELNSKEILSRRERLFWLMLNLMSPINWFWLLFLLQIIVGFISDWRRHRFGNLLTNDS
jgi:ABC-type antimicrobial peptide transport system permease subunit